MTDHAPFDARAVANLMLDVADDVGRQLSNLALQKLMYFAHGLFLVSQKKPLVSGYFEAWQYGPVHPTVYSAFKDASNRPINFRATELNIVTGESFQVPVPNSDEVRLCIQSVLKSYGTLTPGRLVEISHAKDAPWDYIVQKGTSSLAFGLRIPDNVILDRFKYHKVSIGVVPLHGEPLDDAPLA